MKTNLLPSGIGNTNEVLDGKVEKEKTKRNQKKKLENAEMAEYLTKLQKIVPLMPKNKRLSKMEVISYAIEYIRDLRQTLGLSPSQQNNLPNISSELYPPSVMIVNNDALEIKQNDVDKDDHEYQSLTLSPLPSTYHRQPLIDIPRNSDDGMSQQDVSRSITAT